MLKRPDLNVKKLGYNMFASVLQIEPPTVTAREQILALIGPCAVCGAPAYLEGLEEEEALKYVAVHQGLSDGLKMAYEGLRGLFACEACQSLSNEKQARAAQKLRTERPYKLGLMPAHARDMTFELSDPAQEQNPAHWKWGRNWQPTKGNAWIYGDVGIGKSWLINCILNHQAERWGATIALVRAADWCAWGRNWAKDKWRDQVARVDVLHFEDMANNDWDKTSFGLLWTLIDTRASRKLPTLFTANTKAGFLQKGPWYRLNSENPTQVSSLMSRLMPCASIELTGIDLRSAVAEPGKQTEMGG